MENSKDELPNTGAAALDTEQMDLVIGGVDVQIGSVVTTVDNGQTGALSEGAVHAIVSAVIQNINKGR